VPIVLFAVPSSPTSDALAVTRLVFSATRGFLPTDMSVVDLG
jgi:hypothetical protein